MQHKWWSFLFGAVMTAAVLIFVVAPFVGWWLPKNVSSYGGGVDMLFYLILAITGFFFILTEAILVYNMCKFAGGVPGEKAHYVHGNHRLEVFWTIVPAVVLLLIAFLQIKTWADIKYQSTMPEPDQLIEVSARQFEWRMRYATADNLSSMVTSWKVDRDSKRLSSSWSEAPHSDDIHVVNEIHVWKGANVRVYLKTKDVLHSFYLPNLRLKQDAVPGKTIPVWFRVTEANTVYDESTQQWVDGVHYDGETVVKDAQGNLVKSSEQIWDLACAELCGWGHYKMQGRLYVHPSQKDYLKWLARTVQEQSKNKP